MPRTADWPDHLLSVDDLTCFGLADLLDLAAAMKRDPGGWIDAHACDMLACAYDPPTVGMSVSIAMVAKRHEGRVMVTDNP